MDSITSTNYSIHFNSEGYQQLNSHINKNNYSKIFILVDENTHNYCLPQFLSELETTLEIEIIEIESGEMHKNIDTCVGVWNALSELEADRKSLMINLGGGVITDIGGFIASTFKRGIAYIHVPTSLLAMVDASIGGKTGVDLGNLKNQIGVINAGKMVLINTPFLKTLPKNQMRSGLAEMLKHGLITSQDYWDKLKNVLSADLDILDSLIYESVVIKRDVVEKDPNEENLRKTLNYGHTLGHAIEAYFLEKPNQKPLLHGEAIAIGMILANYLSYKLLGFSKDKCDVIKEEIINIFGKVPFQKSDYPNIMHLLKFDKKNVSGKVTFLLLDAIENCKLDIQLSPELIEEGLRYYQKGLA